MEPRIVVISGSLTGTVLPIAEGRLSIGRDSDNDLAVADPVVSRMHCTIRRSEDHYEIADLDSHNGTFVNGIPVRLRQICHGDTIRVGSSEFVFLLDEQTETEMGELCLTDAPTHSDLPVAAATPPSLSGGHPDFGEMARVLTALLRIADISNSIRDPTLLGRELLRLIFETVPAERGAILIQDELENEPRSISAYSRHAGGGESIRIRRDLVNQAMWERSVVVANAEPDGAIPENAICAPLLSVEKTLGVLFLTSTGPFAAFSEGDVHLLRSISRFVAVTFENRLIVRALRSENEELRERIHTSTLVGESRQIGRVKEFISRVAASDVTVLIRGESGTGKELVARAIHHQSPRAEQPFIAINCAAIPDSLLESELFGHEKGAFTGAVATKKGKLELAQEGTLLLDEIGELAPLLQAKLLRVLQQKEFDRVGGTRPLSFAARVVAATNKHLEDAIRSGSFRQDLYYRLNVVSVTVPPLRERHEDIPLLALFFARTYAAKSKRPFRGISREARHLLMNYSWPGNVRELENAIEHAIVLGVGDEILPEDLPSAILEEQPAGSERARYHAVLNKTKRELILAALEQAAGNYPSAAQSLGIHPKYLHRLARNLKIKLLRGTPADRNSPPE